VRTSRLRPVSDHLLRSIFSPLRAGLCHYGLQTFLASSTPARLLRTSDGLVRNVPGSESTSAVIAHRPIRQSMAPMDALPCLVSCFTLVSWPACSSLRLRARGPLATNLLTPFASFRSSGRRARFTPSSERAMKQVASDTRTLHSELSTMPAKAGRPLSRALCRAGKWRINGAGSSSRLLDWWAWCDLTSRKDPRFASGYLSVRRSIIEY
jgi:hypothetical protein